jgi:hypothetical protein
MIYIKNEITRQTLYIPSTLDAVDGAIRLRLYNVIDNTEHIQGVSQGANSGGGAYNLDFDFSFLVDGCALLTDYNSDFNNDYAIMSKGATREDIYYVVSINLPNRLQSGEYEYALLTEDNRHIATGIAIVGEYKNSNNQYNRYEEEYQQYGG